MKVSRSKTEYLCINGGNDDKTVKMENTKVPRVKEFKYLGSTVQESGGCEREVRKRVQAGWNGWRRVSGIICDKMLPARVKGKVYSSVVRPAMVYGLETVAVTKKQVEEMEVAEMKMLRFTMGVTRNENEGMKMREGRLRWYGHVMRRDQEYVGRKFFFFFLSLYGFIMEYLLKIMEMELPGKRRRGRPKRRFLDVVKEDIKEVGVKETDIEDKDVENDDTLWPSLTNGKGRKEKKKKKYMSGWSNFFTLAGHFSKSFELVGLSRLEIVPNHGVL